MTASMDSSHHVFFSPRVQVNLHDAQTLMWLLAVRSPLLDAECRGGDRQGAFNGTHRNFYECAFTQSQHGFHPAVGPLS